MSSQDISLAPPPPGTTSNFINPVSLGPVAVALSVIIILLTMFFVVIRLYSNYNATRGLCLDDLFCVIATVLLFIYIAMAISIRKWASHNYDVPLSALTPLSTKENFVMTALTGPMMFFAKTSMFLLYYRVFAPKKLFRYIITIGIGFCFAVYFAYLAVAAYFCAPHAGKGWDAMILYSCSRSGFYYIISGGANLALDIFMLVLPLPVILRLQLPMNKKVGILAIFMTGLLVFIASTLSLVYKAKLVSESTNTFTNDSLWDSYKVRICDLVETGVTIICSSMPAFASFSKAWALHSAYFTSLHSRLFSRCCLPAFKTKSNSLASSDTRTDPFRANWFKAHPNLDQQFGFGLEEHQGSDIYPLNKTTTEVHGSACEVDIENGIIKKSVTVLQSIT